MTALQEKCLEKEATNEAEGRDDDEPHVFMQIEMETRNVIISRTWVGWSAHIAIEDATV